MGNVRKRGESARVAAKREREKRMVGEMIALWCHAKHGTRRGELCTECAEHAAYACQRSDRCPFMEEKTFCSNCRVHCYRPEMREKIREVMRFAGPRMIFHHPVAALRHVYETQAERRRMRCEEAQ